MFQKEPLRSPQETAMHPQTHPAQVNAHRSELIAQAAAHRAAASCRTPSARRRLRRRTGWWLVGLGLKLAVDRPPGPPRLPPGPGVSTPAQARQQGRAARRASPPSRPSSKAPARRSTRADRGGRPSSPAMASRDGSPMPVRCGPWPTRSACSSWRPSHGKVRSPRPKQPSSSGSHRPTAPSTSARWPSTASSRRPLVARVAPGHGGAPRSASRSPWPTRTGRHPSPPTPSPP